MREVKSDELKIGVKYIVADTDYTNYKNPEAGTFDVGTFLYRNLVIALFKNNQGYIYASLETSRFFLVEKGDIINRRAIRAFAQYPPTNRLPQSIIDLTKSFIKKESDSSAGSSDSMRVNNDRSYNAEANRNSFESSYDESDELDRMKVYVAPTYRRHAGKRSKGTLKKKKKKKKK